MVFDIYIKQYGTNQTIIYILVRNVIYGHMYNVSSETIHSIIRGFVKGVTYLLVHE